MASLLADFMASIRKTDTAGVITTVKELRDNQFGFPLPHYAQQYLFGATGLRIGVFHSIAGAPGSCKSPLLFDLMGHVCSSKEENGLGGLGFLFELETKISPTLFQSVLARYGETVHDTLLVIKDPTIEDALTTIHKKILPMYRKNFANNSVPLIIGIDSIGGSASKDMVDKMNKEGAVGKGFGEKSHIMKNFCENAGAIIAELPVVIMCINQEKEQISTMSYGPAQKRITGGVSQTFKDGHMISASSMNKGKGNCRLITLRTTKTSFCDQRKIEVEFSWNLFGSSEEDSYGHKFNWALASAKCLADPEKGVGEIRDIANVSVSDKNLVTCPQLGLRSVQPEEFEEALFAPENAAVLNALRVYQKIEVIKDVNEYATYLKDRKGTLKGLKEELKQEGAAEPVTKVTKSKVTKAKAKPKEEEGPQQETLV